MTNHWATYTVCTANVAYQMPPSGGCICIGQTSQCFSNRARQHKNDLVAIWQNTAKNVTRLFLRKAAKTECRIVETYLIKKAGDKSVCCLCIFVVKRK